MGSLCSENSRYSGKSVVRSVDIGGATLASFNEIIGDSITQIGQGEPDVALGISINKLDGIAIKYPSSAPSRAFIP